LIFLLDNYDSFTYNLVDYFYQAGVTVLVKRNDEITTSKIEALQPKAIVLSPGPETPKQSGILPEVVNRFAGKIPMLGICLGHQAIGQYLGMELVKAPVPMHGKTSWCTHNQHLFFKNLPNPYEVMRYHSLVLKMKPVDGLSIISSTKKDGLIMALHHQQLKLTGFQFHPESVLTSYGLDMIANWLGGYGLVG